MKKKKVWRYYCDFCKKGGCSASAIASHEKHCTANPNRSCGMCDAAGLNQIPMFQLIAALGHGSKECVATLRDLCEGCPACMLAAIRLSGLQTAEPYFHVEFDFKREKEVFWSGVNAVHAEQDHNIY